MKKHLLLPVFLVTVFISGFSQQTFPDNALHFISQLEKYDKFMGVIAVSKDRQIQFNQAVGYADAEQKIKLNADSKFRVGSISKMFTSVLVLKATEEGKMNLNDKLSSYLPQIPNADSITIEQMLRHRSGIFSVSSAADYLQWCEHPKSRQELIQIILENKPAFEPGTKAEYSNSNFILLGFILEDIYGKKLSVLLTEKITRPLGLTNTSIGSKIEPSGNEAYSYRYTQNWKKEIETDMSIPGGAGAVVSTTKDLITFIEALFDGKLIQAENLDKMTEIKDRYGLGMFRFPFDDKTAYGHSGSIDGFLSMLAYYPKEKVTYCFLSNGMNYNRNEMSIAILSYTFGMPYDLPSFESVTVKQSVLKKYTGEYASEQFPAKIRIFLENEQLMGQATGQDPFRLEASDETNFRNDQAGLKIAFDAKKQSFTLNQGGKSFLFQK
ncbi:MAG: serine hydrolase domain-containing protein [Bacteroidota bacterium]